MTVRDKIREEYFAWLLSIISEDCPTDPWEYSILLRELYSREFYWSIPLDKNRASDGLHLRDRFIEEKNKKNVDAVLNALDGQCSVLEMMIALSERFETHILCDSEKGNRVGEWFWMMIMNMDLQIYTDENYNPSEVIEIINNFLDRRYSRDGRGGLFYIENSRRDLRAAEIWYQACWYFNEILGV